MRLFTLAICIGRADTIDKKKISDTDFKGKASFKVVINGRSYDSYVKVGVYDYHHYDDGRFTYHYNFNKHYYNHLLNSHGIY